MPLYGSTCMLYSTDLLSRVLFFKVYFFFKVYVSVAK